MKNSSKILGNEGEEQARRYLEAQGYLILAQNWRFKKLEVDIIASKGEHIVFVEVKTRKNNTFGEPEVFVTRKKQNFLISAAHHYLIEQNVDLQARFDIVAIITDEKGSTVKHLEGAFYPTISK